MKCNESEENKIKEYFKTINRLENNKAQNTFAKAVDWAIQWKKRNEYE